MMPIYDECEVMGGITDFDEEKTESRDVDVDECVDSEEQQQCITDLLLRPDWASKDEELRSYPMLLTKENYETHKEVLDQIRYNVTLDDKQTKSTTSSTSRNCRTHCPSSAFWTTCATTNIEVAPRPSSTAS